MKNYLLVDHNPTVLNREAISIARKISVQDSSAKIRLMYFEHEKNTSEEKLLSLCPPNTTLEKVNYTSRKDVESSLRAFNPSVVIFFAQRIPDSVIVLIAKRLGYPTLMFQHGLYTGFMKRSISLFIERLGQAIRYIYAVKVIANETKKTYLRLLYDYIQIFIFGKDVKDTILPTDKLNVDRVLLNGEHWKEYHKKQFAYRYDQQEVVGYPELFKTNEIKKEEREDAICYIVQSLIEDGRINKLVMLSFYDTLKEVSKNIKLYIKLHPRSNTKLFDALKDEPNIVFLDKKIPHCTHYIGHYSSLIALCIHLSNNILLWEFEGHPTPDLLKVASVTVTNNKETLENFVTNNKNNTSVVEPQAEVLEEFNKVFYFDGENPYDAIASLMLKDY